MVEKVVQYRARNFRPLIRLKRCAAFQVHAIRKTRLSSIVYSEPEHRRNVVDNVFIDIVEQTIEPSKDSQSKKWASGSAVIQGQVTDLIDLPAIH